MGQDAPQVFTSRMVRELKGAPLACLILLIMAEMPMSNEWLEMMTGYSDKPVSHALKLLSSPEYQMVVRVSKGWRIAKGLQMALPLINRNISVSATATESLINDLSNESVVVVGRNFSETLEVHENCHFVENLAMCKRLGIGEPSASKISDSFNVLGEAIDPEFIKAHVDSRARGEGLGLAIVRILNGEFPAIWQKEIDDLPVRENSPDPVAIPLDSELPSESCVPEPQSEIDIYWGSVLSQLKDYLPRASFDTWVSGTKPISYQDGKVTIGVRDAYARDWLEDRLNSTITRLLIGTMNANVTVNFTAMDSVI